MMLPRSQALHHTASLHTLGLGDAQLGEGGGIAVAEVLDCCASLRRLDLRKNELGVAGLMAIVMAMKSNGTLVEVHRIAMLYAML